MSAVSGYFNRNCTCDTKAHLPLAASLLPIIGPIIEIFQERKIVHDIAALDPEQEASRATVIEKFKESNKYKITGIIRDLLCFAATITIVALGILHPAGLILAAGFAICVGIHLYRMIQNNEVINKVRLPTLMQL
ncbi:MAG: hypothetical protein JSS32_05090 [Verrucomicrobia bacterium]|nr:hypothetical protein [Verrucomicrobiota bacterium]